MKTRSLMVMMLIGLLGFGMIFAGCENGTTPNDDDKKEEDVVEKVVAEKYRGTWQISDVPQMYLTLLDKYCLPYTGVEHDAWTEGTDLFLDNKKCGYFENDTTLKFNDTPEWTDDYLTYTKQP